MNTYPGIYKALDGTIYYYLNKNNFFSPERNRWEEDCDNDDHKTDVNITRECLENTYGKVESKEHADFLIKLAEKNKIKLGIGGYSERKNYFYFTEDEGLLYLVFASFSPSNKHTSITIPLPPKEPEEDSMKKPERKLLASILTLEHLGYTYHGGELWKPPIAEAIKEPEPKEWPLVGDEVSLRYRFDSKEIHITGKLEFISDKHLIVENCHKLRSEYDIEKPPTPEEELREKLKEELSLYISFHDPHDTKIDLADAILDGEIEGLSYKPE